MKTISMDLRTRILAAYDTDGGTREEVGRRFRVSVGMVKKLLQQRRHTGDIGPRHHRSGRKALIVASHRKRLQRLLVEKPDMTLQELRSALEIQCTPQAIHYVLADMGLTYKKRRFGQANKIGLTWRKRAADGLGSKAAGIRANSCSSTNRRPRRT